MRASRLLCRDAAAALDTLLPTLTRAADHAVLWVGISAVLMASKRRPAQRAGRRGIVSLAVTSLLVNAIGKRAMPRKRPALGAVPVARRARRRPSSSSFPSGHAASAAAYATAAGHADPVLGPPLAALAATVGFSRVYTGMHHPSDVLVGAALGTAVGLVGNRLAPLRTQDPVRVIDPLPASQPPRPEGEGVVVVANPLAGGGRAAGLVDGIRRQLPACEVIELAPGSDLLAALRDAASRAEVLGVVGGDGSVSAGALVALETGLPLLAVPGGTFNHFTGDLGVGNVADAVRAVREGSAIRIDVGTIREAAAGAGTDSDYFAGPGTPGALRHVFVNTASLGSYPSFVRARERVEARLGKRVAAAVAIGSVLRTEEPLRAVINGRELHLAMMFIGNGRYQPQGFVPAWRPRLDDGRLDLRLVQVRGRVPLLRLVASLLAGRLGRSRLYTEVGSGGLYVHLPDGPTRVARDGEVGPEVADLHFGVERLALTVYRPAGRAEQIA